MSEQIEQQDQQKEFYINLPVIDPQSKCMIVTRCSDLEYLYKRSDLDYNSDENSFTGMLCSVILSELKNNNLIIVAQELMNRLHAAMFNPKSDTNLQVVLANRTLRAYLGAMPIDTLTARVTLHDEHTELGEWATIFRQYIIPYLVEYEKYKTTDVESNEAAPDTETA